jgi:protein arginine N-methyltransferase 2
LKPLLDTPGQASCQDPTTGETPLHASIRACGYPIEDEPPTDSGEKQEELCVQEAKETIHELFLWGAIWNDVDNHNETPGCVAWRLKRPELYKLCVEAGVRAEMLFGLMGGYEELSSGPDEEDEVQEDVVMAEEQKNGAEPHDTEPRVDGEVANESKSFSPPQTENDKQVTSDEYLKSALTYSESKLVDDDGNAVMMAWETDIMRRSVESLLPGKAAERRILNIGLGMGIIDTMFADTTPARHHIIEAHPAVIEHLPKPDAKFGSSWERSGPSDGAFKVHKGRWQDIVPTLVEQGEVYDAIYFDTFGEDYSQLKLFFTEYVPALLDQDGRFGFFNGLGADRRISYDVYTKVVEMHLSDAGLDVEWDEIDVDMSSLNEDGKGEWVGVRRRYWTLDSTSTIPEFQEFHEHGLIRCRVPSPNQHIHGIESFARHGISIYPTPYSSQSIKFGLDCPLIT